MPRTPVQIADAGERAATTPVIDGINRLLNSI
jgi:hypothetical protein